MPHNWIDKLEDLVLWNIVSQCAGTITHSPEKVCNKIYESDWISTNINQVCEVFHYTKHFVRDNGVHGGMIDRLLEVFSVYSSEVIVFEM